MKPIIALKTFYIRKQSIKVACLLEKASNFIGQQIYICEYYFEPERNNKQIGDNEKNEIIYYNGKYSEEIWHPCVYYIYIYLYPYTYILNQSPYYKFVHDTQHRIFIYETVVMHTTTYTHNFW